MGSHITSDSTTPRPIEPGRATVEAIEAIMADRLCILLPAAGDCLEDVGVVNGGWVVMDFTRWPAPPRCGNKGDDGSSGPRLCYVMFPRALGPMVIYEEYQDVWGPWQIVGTQCKSM